MDSFLDVMSIITNVAYVGFMVAALRLQVGTKTLASLIKACQHYWTAAALATLVLIINLVAVPYDGWWQPALNTFTLALVLSILGFVTRERDRKAIHEMQRDLGRDL